MKKKDSVLVLKHAGSDFERFYTNKLNMICDANNYYNNYDLFQRIWNKCKLPYEHIWYGDWKKNLNKYELIIIFDCIRSANIIKYLYKKTESRIVYWHWNPITEFDLSIIEETHGICENWSFNPYDVEKYELRYNNQFYFNVQNTHPMGEGVFFVGSDKGRYQMICEVIKLLKKYSIHTDFYLFDKKVSNHSNPDIKYTTTYIQYDEIIKRIQSSKCILEIVQNNQSGLTVRALEALFYKRKLITNNKDIKKYDFYNENNIFVIDDDIRSLEDFYYTPYLDIDEKILYKYTAESWIDNFYK